MGITKLSPHGSFMPPSLEPIAFKFDFINILSPNMIIVIFTFLFVDIFDTVGTLVGVCTKANMLTKDGEVPRCKQALFADSIGTVAGACLGTSTVTTFVESASGVAEGGKTGLTSLVFSVLMFISLFLSNIFLSIPSAATAPALIIVGLFMMTPILEINFEDYTESIPAFICIIFMPFAYSIAEGITFGVLSFTLLKLVSGKIKEISLFTWILSAFLLLKIFMPIIQKMIN